VGAEPQSERLEVIIHIRAASPLRGGAAEEGRLEAELRGRSGSRVPLDVGVHFGVCQFGIPASESIAECVLEQSYGPRLAHERI